MPSSSSSSRRSASIGDSPDSSLPPGEFPVARIRRPGQTLREQHAAVVAHEHRRCDAQDPTLAGLSHSCASSLGRRARRCNASARRRHEPGRTARRRGRCATRAAARTGSRRDAVHRSPSQSRGRGNAVMTSSQAFDRGKVVVLAERIERDPQAEAFRQRYLLLDRFAGMHFLADVPRLEVLAEVFGQQVPPIRRRVDQHVRRRRRRSCRRASP